MDAKLISHTRLCGCMIPPCPAEIKAQVNCYTEMREKHQITQNLMILYQKENNQTMKTRQKSWKMLRKVQRDIECVYTSL